MARGRRRTNERLVMAMAWATTAAAAMSAMACSTIAPDTAADAGVGLGDASDADVVLARDGSGSPGSDATSDAPLFDPNQPWTDPRVRVHFGSEPPGTARPLAGVELDVSGHDAPLPAVDMHQHWDAGAWMGTPAPAWLAPARVQILDSCGGPQSRTITLYTCMDTTAGCLTLGFTPRSFTGSFRHPNGMSCQVGDSAGAGAGDFDLEISLWTGGPPADRELDVAVGRFHAVCHQQDAPWIDLSGTFAVRVDRSVLACAPPPAAP